MEHERTRPERDRGCRTWNGEEEEMRRRLGFLFGSSHEKDEGGSCVALLTRLHADAVLQEKYQKPPLVSRFKGFNLKNDPGAPPTHKLTHKYIRIETRKKPVNLID